MKVKKWYIHVIAMITFVTCFIAINLKYDPFYRVNGINNENRVLIEQYLDAGQQQYLIENSIAVDTFIQYIQTPGFILQNYEYYNILNTAKVFSNKEELVMYANIIVSRLEVSFGYNALQQCRQLVSNNLVWAFIEQEAFDFQNIEYYQIVRTLYDNSDYRYIEHTNLYVNKLHNEGFDTDTRKRITLRELTSNYDKESLHLLLTTPLPGEVEIVLNPREPSVIVDSRHFIGSYQPKHMVAVSGIGRATYSSMFLDEDAYHALKHMYDDLIATHGRGVILMKSFRSYEILSMQEETYMLELPGFSEFQLGTTVAFQHLDYSLEDFGKDESYRWLVENAHRYGYILRYPEGKEAITGKQHFNNIFRYVGEELATFLYENDLTLEEYHAQANDEVDE